MLNFFSTAPFYSDNVSLPDDFTPPSLRVQDDPKFWPYFKDALAAIDGTHFNAIVTAAEREAARDRKGNITQNCLAGCDFDMKFIYIFPGWEGSTPDSTMYNDARITDLRIPPGKYYLADAGFPICESLMIPYRGVCYHLAEWGRARLR
jgi:hypothetical protein